MQSRLKLTIILILHNRHHNMHRLFEYYKNSGFYFIFADSSQQQHTPVQPLENCIHLYTPGLSFTEKIEYVLQHVTTPYVAMCADDDFLLPDALDACINFLEAHHDYNTAQGQSICYLKNSIATGHIQYEPIYHFSRSIEDDDALTRFQNMFLPYRSVLYAVFRKDVLMQAFNGAGKYVRNLFLNEYITAFIPVVHGKYKELDVLYQVREYASDSDDKTTPDMDALALSDNESEQEEYSLFKQFVYDKIVQRINIPGRLFEDVLNEFNYTLAYNTIEELYIKKDFTAVANRLPVIGKWLIETHATEQLKINNTISIPCDLYTLLSKYILKTPAQTPAL